jgi:hypothetical protein
MTPENTRQEAPLARGVIPDTGRTVTVTSEPTSIPISLQAQVYNDIKSGAFAVVLVGAIVMVWFTRTWGKDLRDLIKTTMTTMEQQQDTLEKMGEQIALNSKAIQDIHMRIDAALASSRDR